MDAVVELLLRGVVTWIRNHPDAPFSRFMTKRRGPRTDVREMTRLQRLSSALGFLLWGCLCLALLALISYLAFGSHLISPENLLVQVAFFGLALLSGCGLLGGLYLLFRTIL